MFEESGTSVTKSPAIAQNPNSQEPPISDEATIESNVRGGTESTCDNNKAETSAITSPGDAEKSLEYANQLMEKGAAALKEKDFDEAADCFSRALEIRAGHYGELASECVSAYYKYGCALLDKAQEEADPLGAVPKKDGQSLEDTDKNGSVKIYANGGSSTTSVANEVHEEMRVNQEGIAEQVSNDEEKEEGNADSDADDLGEVDEDESDLDMAWKMLDLARAIVDKNSGDTVEKVNILSALAEVSLEREDIETSLSDYKKALSILEGLVKPDSRQIADLNFRICLCLEVGSMPEEAIPYCKNAISVCKSRVQRLLNGMKSSPCLSSSSLPELDQSVQSLSDKTLTDKEAEIETLKGVADNLEKKLEDLQQQVSNPKSVLAELMGMVGKARGNEKSDSSQAVSSSRLGTATSTGKFDLPTVSAVHTNGAAGVTDLGIVGRGVKRVSMSLGTTEPSLAKKPSLDKASDRGDGNA